MNADTTPIAADRPLGIVRDTASIVTKQSVPLSAGIGVVSAFIGACFALLSASSTAAEISLKDDLGRTVEMAAPAKRIVTLAPALTELVFTAGAGGRVVGVSAFSDYPPQAKKLPQVSSAVSWSLEEIAALHPDLVLAWHDNMRVQDVSRLSAFGIAVYVADARNFEDVPRTLEAIGTLVGRDTSAAIRAYRDKLDRLRAKYASKPRVTALLEIWHSPLTTIAGRHFMNEALEICGARNVFADVGGVAPVVGWEEVIVRDPDVIVGINSAGSEKRIPRGLERTPDASRRDAGPPRLCGRGQAPAPHGTHARRRGGAVRRDRPRQAERTGAIAPEHSTGPEGSPVGEPDMGSMLTAKATASCTRGSECAMRMTVSPMSFFTIPSERGLPSLGITQSSRPMPSFAFHGFTMRTLSTSGWCMDTTMRGTASEAVSTATKSGSASGAEKVHSRNASSTWRLRPTPSRTGASTTRPRGRCGARRDSIARHTRAGGSTGATPCASGVIAASQRATVSLTARSEAIIDSKRALARPRSVPSANSAASASQAWRRELHGAAVPMRQSRSFASPRRTCVFTVPRGLPRCAASSECVRPWKKARAIVWRCSASSSSRHFWTEWDCCAGLGVARGRRALVDEIRRERIVHVGLLASAAHDVEAAVAHDRRHPRERRALRRGVVRRAPPDVDETVLQRLPPRAASPGLYEARRQTVSSGSRGRAPRRRCGRPARCGRAALRGGRRSWATYFFSSRPGFHRGSGTPSAALMERATRKSRSESRFRYWMDRAETASTRPSATSERSARRQMARARWHADAAGVPPGRMNSFSTGSGSRSVSMRLSISVDMGIPQRRAARNAHLAAQVEEVVLHRSQDRANPVGHVFGQHHAQGAVQLVDFAHGGHARRVLAHALAVAQPGRSVVAGAGHDLRQAICHGRPL